MVIMKMYSSSKEGGGITKTLRIIPVHKWQDRVDGTPGPMPDLIELGGQIIHRWLSDVRVCRK